MEEEVLLSTRYLNFKCEEKGSVPIEELIISNKSETIKLFKIMTTARTRYLVKPSSGFIQPNSDIKIDINLSLKYSETNKQNLEDKFAVYTLSCEKVLQNKNEIDNYISNNKHLAKKLIIISKISLKKELQIKETTTDEPRNSDMFLSSYSEKQYMDPIGKVLESDNKSEIVKNEINKNSNESESIKDKTIFELQAQINQQKKELNILKVN